jgi:hypothetical protein
MNTQNTFLRFKETDHLDGDGEERQEVYCSISDLTDSGVPIDDFGDDMESDGFLYFRKGHDQYEKII